MKKQILIIAIALLLVLPMISAVDLGKIEPINWKATQLTIKDDGVYNGISLVKEIDKAEIWIDKKIGNTYHVDSLVVPDTRVYVELWYDIQPDTIDYLSHNGKYKELFGKNGKPWEWTDANNETGGGWAKLDVTLEYALGSNTFTSAISGATWANDGIDITLVDGTNYDLTLATFTIIDENLAWTQIETEYTYNQITNEVGGMRGNLTEGVANVSNKIPTILIIAIVIVLFGALALLLKQFGLFELGNRSEL